uniref:Uncharacterized protein LOC114339701 n=1 Tax=Diabrotica virgifera virgifera TaxID=50390 RepID=A0A6P7GA96_DIAVI
MSVSDTPTEELTDPAILVIRETVKISYSKEELLNMREAPLSKKKPDFFDTSEVTTSIWTPNDGYSKSDTPIENEPRSSGDEPSEHRRRPGDPREESEQKATVSSYHLSVAVSTLDASYRSTVSSYHLSVAVSTLDASYRSAGIPHATTDLIALWDRRTMDLI